MRHPELVTTFQELWNQKESLVRLNVGSQLSKMSYTFHWENRKIVSSLGIDLNQSNLVVTKSGIRSETLFSPYPYLNKVRTQLENQMEEKFNAQMETSIDSVVKRINLENLPKSIKQLDTIQNSLQGISETTDRMQSLEQDQTYSQNSQYQRNLLNQRLQTEGTLRISFPLQAGRVIK